MGQARLDRARDGTTERWLDLGAVLPRATDGVRALAEATALDASFDPAIRWNAIALADVMRELERFDRCPDSACKPYVRRRLDSPFAGSEGDPRSLRSRVEDFERLIDGHFRARGVPGPSRQRRRLLVAAYLLLLECHARVT